MSDDKKYSVYEILSLIDGKRYIGESGNIKKRWNRHLNMPYANCYLVHNAMRKHGAKNFVFSIIEQFDTEVEALSAEKEWIAHYKTNVCRYGPEFGYNLTDGGDGISGWKHTEEAKKKISEAGRNRKVSEETKEKLRQINLNMTPEHKRKISIAKKGKKFTQEHKINMSLVRIGKHKGDKNPFWGKKHSDKSRKIISDKNTGHKHSEEQKAKISQSNIGKHEWTNEMKKDNSLRKRRFTDQDIKDIEHKKIVLGYTYKQIADEYHVHWKTVSRALNKKDTYKKTY